MVHIWSYEAAIIFAVMVLQTISTFSNWYTIPSAVFRAWFCITCKKYINTDKISFSHCFAASIKEGHFYVSALELPQKERRRISEFDLLSLWFCNCLWQPTGTLTLLLFNRTPVKNAPFSICINVGAFYDSAKSDNSKLKRWRQRISQSQLAELLPLLIFTIAYKVSLAHLHYNLQNEITIATKYIQGYVCWLRGWGNPATIGGQFDRMGQPAPAALFLQVFNILKHCIGWQCLAISPSEDYL